MQRSIPSEKIRLIIQSTLIILLSSFANGCTYYAKVANMVPTSYEIGKKHAGSVRVEVTGRKKTSSVLEIGKAFVKTEDFKTVLETGISNSGLFFQVVETPYSTYLLRVNIVEQFHPAMGAAMRARLVTRWELLDGKTIEPIWQDIIGSTHETKAFESFLGNIRARMAFEGAVKNNVSLGIAELSTLDLKQSGPQTSNQDQ